MPHAAFNNTDFRRLGLAIWAVAHRSDIDQDVKNGIDGAVSFDNDPAEMGKALVKRIGYHLPNPLPTDDPGLERTVANLAETHLKREKKPGGSWSEWLDGWGKLLQRGLILLLLLIAVAGAFELWMLEREIMGMTKKNMKLMQDALEKGAAGGNNQQLPPMFGPFVPGGQ